MKKYFFIAAFLFTIVLSGGSVAQETDALPDCEWCGAKEAPENVSWETTIAGKNEEGEPLIINGTVYKSDGKTPAANVLLYIYHTNSKGIYAKKRK